MSRPISAPAALLALCAITSAVAAQTDGQADALFGPPSDVGQIDSSRQAAELGEVQRLPATADVIELAGAEFPMNGEGDAPAEPERPPLVGSAGASPSQPQRYFEIEYLFWDLEGVHLPVLLTANPPDDPLTDIGRIDAPSTQALVGGEEVGDFAHSGMRFRVGKYFDDFRWTRVEFGGWFLFDNRNSWRVASADGDSILSRPFIDATTGMPNAQLIGMPGFADGSLGVDYRRRLFGFDPLLFLCLRDDGCRWAEAFVGYRYWRYEDALDVFERVAPAAGGLIAPGTEFRIEDHFRAANDYHLVPLGLSFTSDGDEWRFEARGSVSLGFVRQEVTIAGTTELTVDGEPFASYPGGFLALDSNSGSHDRTRFAWVPKWEFVLRRRVGAHSWLHLGYSIFYINEVARAPNQVDSRIDPNLLPPALTPASSSPAFAFRSQGELVHGLNAGCLWEY